jgi:hypothetical protein
MPDLPAASTPSSGLAAATPAPSVLGLDRVTLSADGRSLDVTFVGAAPMADQKPCGADYVHSESIVDATLEVTVTQVASRMGACPLTELVCCERTFTVDLPVESRVDRVRDMGRRAARMDQPSAGLYFLERPDGVLDLNGLPEGWSMVREQADWGGTWTRFYGSTRGSSQDSAGLEFRAWFDGELNSEPEYLQPSVQVNGHEAEYSKYDDTGEIALQWMDRALALMLLGLQRDFAIEDLVALAETAAPIAEDAR